MSNADSTCIPLALVISFALVSACTSMDPLQSGLGKDPSMGGVFDREENPLVVAFQQSCLSGQELPMEISHLVTANGWQPAQETDLETSGLMPLRKMILEIPGGGGRFSEEQYLFSRPAQIGFDVLNVERRYFQQQTLATQCDIYGAYDFLQNCEALGKLLKKAPDHNQTYKHNGAHFIRWNLAFNGKNVIVSCNKLPAPSSTVPSNISLSLKIDHTIPTKSKSHSVKRELSNK